MKVFLVLILFANTPQPVKVYFETSGMTECAHLARHAAILDSYKEAYCEVRK